VEHSKREVELMAIAYNRSDGTNEVVVRLDGGLRLGIVLDLFLNVIILDWFYRLKKR
jgi:hypothetical protein